MLLQGGGATPLGPVHRDASMMRGAARVPDMAGKTRAVCCTEHGSPMDTACAPGSPVGQPAPTVRRAGQTETQVVVAPACGVPVANGRARVAGIIVPTPAAQDWASQASAPRREAEGQKSKRERASRARTAGCAGSKGVRGPRFKGKESWPDGNPGRCRACQWSSSRERPSARSGDYRPNSRRAGPDLSSRQRALDVHP